MTKQPESQRDVIDSLRVDVAVIKDQMIGLRDSNKAILSKVEGFQFAKQSEVDKLAGVAVTVENRLTSIEQKVSPMWKMYGLIFATLVTGIIGLGFWIIQKVAA